uniref:Secreted protein n=1 Tax=Heterorhabditis bacteriophora TaxID=37862 RepID=A0A1I7XPP9_HETBA
MCFLTSTLFTSYNSTKAAFGGLIFSQALAAAENTVNEEMKPHSMHSFFIMSG